MKFLINPNQFNKFTDIIFKPLIFLATLTLMIGLIFALLLSPNDYQQGLTVRIMYVHVPSAWLALLTFFIMTIYSILGLAFKMPFSFIINSAIAPIGATFTLICLVTGSLWGKPMWGTWWVWDARLTSMLILTFIYLGHFLVLNSFEHFQKSDFAAAILAVIGLVNLPVVKFSVNWWTTLHQGASVFKVGGPSLSGIYLLTLMISFFCVLTLCMYWIANIFITIIEKRRYERIKLFNE